MKRLVALVIAALALLSVIAPPTLAADLKLAVVFPGTVQDADFNT